MLNTKRTRTVAYRPISRAVGVAAFLALAALTAFSGALLTAQEPTPEEQMLALLNRHRADNGQAPLLIDPSLTAAAEAHAFDMGQQDYFSHTSLDGRSPWQRMCDAGYCWNTYKGENIGAGYCCAADVHAAWAASPGHNANMLSEHFRVVGLGHANVPGSTYTVYWVQDFGGYVVPYSPTPAPECPDLNSDGTINIADVLAFRPVLASGAYDPAYDLNGDGTVSLADILVLKPWFGAACFRDPQGG